MLATDDPTDGLVLTGERTLPGIADENYWFRRHEAAYLAVAPFAIGAHVLEAGCGEGYGAALLADRGARVVGLDYDVATVAHVARTYGSVQAVRGNLLQLPLADGAVEVVVCLQVLEHLWDQPGFIAECARVLAPAGTLVISTPNRLTFSPGRTADEPPLNPFHARELAAADVVELLDADFAVSRLYGVTHGRRLRRFERRRGALVDAQIAGPPEQWSRAVRAVVHSVTAADFDVREDSADHPIDESLDLLVVATKRTGA